MRWANGFAMVLLGVALQGCIMTKSGGDLIRDSVIVGPEFDERIAFEPADDADAAEPPLDVHEIDEGQVAGAGGKKVVDGGVWLQANDYERNDILNLVAEAQPEDTILVIVVATGDIWQIPLAAGQALPEGVRPWSGPEYREIEARSNGVPDSGDQLTRDQFDEATAVVNRNALAQLYFLHLFGPVGYSEIVTRQGLQVALAATWMRESPVQRYLRLVMLQNYFGRLPQFQGPGNQLAFAVMMPGGSVFVMPAAAYLNMIRQAALRAWLAYEITGMPTALLLLDRAIKNTRIVVEPADEP